SAGGPPDGHPRAEGAPAPLGQQDEGPLGSALLKWERSIAALPRERAYLLAPDGAVLFQRRGDASEIRFTRRQLRLMPGNTLTHNHPSGWTRVIPATSLTYTRTAWP